MEGRAAHGGIAVDRTYAIAQQAGTGPDIARFAAVDFRRIGKLGSALPQPGGEWIFAFRQRALAEIAADQQRVAIKPFGIALAFAVDDEAVFHEGSGLHVEFAHDGGILAPVGQRNHAVTHFGRQAGRAFVDPFLAFCGGQRIDVQHGFPLRFVAAIAFERGTAQNALRILLVLPEIIQAIRAEGDIGDLVFAVIDRQRFRLELGEAGVCHHVGGGPLVLGLDPVQGLVTAGFFQPDEGIFVGAGDAVLR